jgi:hypothetical protein
MSDPGDGAPGPRAALPALPFGQQATEPLPAGVGRDPVPVPAADEVTEPVETPPHNRTRALPSVPPPAFGPEWGALGVELPAVAAESPAGIRAAARGWRRLPYLPVLAAGTALLLVVAVVLAALLVTATGERDRARAEAVASRQDADARARELAASRTEATRLRRDLTRARADLAATREQLTGAQSRLGSTEADKQVISHCLGLILQFFDAAGAGDGEKARQALVDANKPCEAADAVANPA